MKFEPAPGYVCDYGRSLSKEEIAKIANEITPVEKIQAKVCKKEQVNSGYCWSRGGRSRYN